MVRQLRILVSQFRVLRTGTRSEIRPDNMYQPLYASVSERYDTEKLYNLTIEKRIDLYSTPLPGRCSLRGIYFVFSPPRTKKRNPNTHCTHWQSHTNPRQFQSFAKECNFANAPRDNAINSDFYIHLENNPWPF